MKRIFISSVQKEFADERRLLKRYISKNPAYKRLFDTFVFEEDVVATDRRTDQVYLDELGRCDIYIGLIGNEYGYEDAQGVSPTEREYDEATRLGLTRLVFVLNKDDSKRQPKEAAFLRKISADLIRAKCDDSSALLLEIYSSLEGLLVESGAYRMGPFDASVCDGATINDIDADKVSWFVRKAREIRNADIDVDMPAESVLSHLRLFSGKSGGLTNAAILLFGKNPQRFLISSEVKCAQWTEQNATSQFSLIKYTKAHCLTWQTLPFRLCYQNLILKLARGAKTSMLLGSMKFLFPLLRRPS